MFVEQARTTNQSFFTYLIGILILVLFIVVGQLPLGQALVNYAEGPIDPTDPVALLNVLPSNIRLILQMLPFVVGLLGLIFIARFLHQQTAAQLISSRIKIDWSRSLFAFTLWGIFTILFVAISVAADPGAYVWNFQWESFLTLLVLGLLLIPLQTSFEEILFRGYLMQGFGVLIRNRWGPWILTSVLFGALHFANPEIEEMGYGLMLYYIGTGFFLGLITIVDEGLELALGFHAANNLFSALLISSSWTAFQTDALFIFQGKPSLWLETGVSLIICYPLLFFIFRKKYGWDTPLKKLFRTP